ncbi:ABC transporter ATP-binding protein [Rhizobium brockwellii]|uniref:ABC transporter ATP-binding protein n=1 Tax=Rhizobium brockwellii TaxID=3019932 RepID=UPI003F976CD2
MKSTSTDRLIDFPKDGADGRLTDRNRDRVQTAATTVGGDIALSGVTKSFGGKTVLEAIDLSLAAGEFFAMLGPSGSGKSTLLNLIAGFERPDKGDISIRGRSVVDVPAYARHVGVVFQNYALFPHLNIAENLAYPLMRKGMDAGQIEDRVCKMLALIQLGDYAHASVLKISGGQQQRVAIARALIAEPDVLLMDEPMAALDKALRDDLQVELKTLQRKLGTTVIYITHDQREAMALADRIGVMNAGRFEQIGTPREIYNDPATAFTARFISGSTIIDGKTALREGTWYLETPEGVRFPGNWHPNARVQADVPAKLAINPSSVKISSHSAQSQSELPATVTASLYGGETTAVHLLIGSHPIVVSETGWSERRAGDVVSVKWAQDDATLFNV